MKKNVEKIYKKYEKNKLNGINQNYDLLNEEEDTIILDDSIYDEDEAENNENVNKNKNFFNDKSHKKNSKSVPLFSNDNKKIIIKSNKLTK